MASKWLETEIHPLSMTAVGALAFRGGEGYMLLGNKGVWVQFSPAHH